MIHQHFNTPEGGGALRSYYLAKALINSGHQISVITSHKNKTSRVTKVDGIDVHYLPIPYENRFGFYARSWAFLKFIFNVIALSSRYKDYDITYGISAPLTVGIANRWMKFRYGIPYIFEVGDLWPDAPIQLGFVKNSLLKRLLFGLEKAIYREADSIVALSPMIGAAIKQKMPGKKIHFIPNMADCDFYCPEAKRKDMESKYRTIGKTVVSYIGSLGVANGLHYLLECAATSLQTETPIQFIICGDGAMLADLKKEAAAKRLDNVTFTGFVNRAGVKEVMNVTDAIFVCYNTVPILETGCPNKYFDGLAGGKIILINFGGWIRREIEESGCGIYINPTERSDFMKKVLPLVMKPEQQQPMQRAARKLAENKYSRKLLGETFSKLF